MSDVKQLLEQATPLPWELGYDGDVILTRDGTYTAVTGWRMLVPPKPGTDAYKALPSGTERAAAKAWHEKHPEPEQETLAEQLRVET
jgi:hypothetical protein